jgi:murein DD-endopeptidase MepM/ murein hydrolase activator NlpD
MAFLDLVKSQRKKGSGILSSLNQSALQSMDPRNLLFKRGGVLNALFPKVSGYRADNSASPKIDPSPTSLSSSENIKDLSVRLDIIGKNTLALPSMARDMFLVKQNIIKLVNFQKKGSAQEKSGDWLSRQMARETAYESNLSKLKSQSATSPSKITKANNGSSSGILGGLFNILGSLGSVLGGLTVKFIGLRVIMKSFGLVFRLLTRFIMRSPIGLALGLVGASALLGSDANAASNDTDDETKSNTTKNIGNAAAGLGATALGANAISTINKTRGLAAKTGSAILDARTMSVGQMANSTPKSYWGKFLRYVAKKSPLLWGRIGLKLAQAGALAAIPIFGWVGSAISLGFTVWMAWELYELWSEFNNVNDESRVTNSPSKINSDLKNTRDELLRNSNGNLSPGANPEDFTNFETPTAESNTPSKMPAGGFRVSGVFGEERGTHKHGGVDLAAPAGTPVSSTDNGTVTRSEFSSSYGNVVYVDHGDGKETRYAHLSKLDVRNGDKVTKGQKIGEVGNTGRSFGNHLHYEERLNGVAIAPDMTRAQASLGAATQMLANNNTVGSQLTGESSTLANAQRNSSQSQPIVLNAPTTNNNNSSNAGNISIPSASGVYDNEFSKLLINMVVG